MVVGVDSLHDAAVGGQHYGRVIWPTGSDEALGAGEGVEDRGAERLADRRAELGLQRLGGAVHQPWSDLEMTGLLLGGQPGQHAWIAEQSLCLQLVQPADDLGYRQGDRYADEPDAAASQHRRYEYGSVYRRRGPDHGEGDLGNLQ